MVKKSGENNKYTLHECIIDEIINEESSIKFIFNSGIYSINEEATTRTNKCVMEFVLPSFNIDEAYEYISVKFFYKKRIKRFQYMNLLKLLSKNKFKVYMDYYSELAQSILLIGTLKNYEVELIITDIKDIKFNFY